MRQLFGIFGLLLMSAMFSFVSCEKSTFKLSGILSSGYYDGDTVLLRQYQNDSLMNVGFTTIKEGSFELEGNAAEPYMAGLYLNSVLLVPLVVEPGDIRVKLTGEEASVSGTPLNDALYEYIDRVDSFEVSLAEISRMEARLIMDGSDADAAKGFVERTFLKTNLEMEIYIDNFIKGHYNDILGPFVFRQWYGQMLYPMSSERVKNIMQDAPECFKEHQYVKGVVSTDN